MRNQLATYLILLLLSLPMAACTQPGGMSFSNTEGAPALKPKATISLEYPNPWDINNQIALSNDGSRLIDASSGARYIRVWDWQNEKVVQQLLLNEKAPEGVDKRPHNSVLDTSPGQDLALSQDGKIMAACAHTEKGSTRVWNLESGVIVVDIPYLNRHAPKQDPENIFGLGCDSISFSSDGKYMAVLSQTANLYTNEANLEKYNKLHAGFNYTTMKYANGMSPDQVKAEMDKIRPPLEVVITGVALFETTTWKLERIFYRPYQKQLFKSHPLFDADNKTVSAVIFDQAPAGVWNTWVGNRVVRWDIATGTQLEEQNMPQLVNGEEGLWWESLPSGREVWWRNGFLEGFRRSPTVNDERTLYQTDSAAEQCRISPVPNPTFESDVISNCAYLWVLSVLNLDTGKIRYLAPSRKNSLKLTGETPAQLDWASISPDGKHIVLFHRTMSVKNNLRASSSIKVLSTKTQQIEGFYSVGNRIDMKPVFSGDSRFFALPVNTNSYSQVQSAMIFELPKK